MSAGNLSTCIIDILRIVYQMTNYITSLWIKWLYIVVNAAPLVKYGLTPQMKSTQYDVNIHTYEANEMCKDPANSTGFWAPGYMYDSVLTDLKPNTRYFYSYGTEKVINQFLPEFPMWVVFYTFCPPPPPPPRLNPPWSGEGAYLTKRFSPQCINK